MKIVAIGGGEIGRPGHPIETRAIDEEIIDLSKKAAPKLLFIPTASSDAESYIEVVKKYFGSRLGCEVDALHLLNKKIPREEIEKKVFSSDIIYVGGGNTLKMMNVWRKHKLDEILKNTRSRDIVLSGLSAGAICWFRYGSSDSRRFRNPNADLIKVRGLDLIPALFCPHYDVEEDREDHLRNLMKKTSGVALAVDNCCAIEVLGDQYRIIKSKKAANAYKVYWKRGGYYKDLLKQKDQFSPLSGILEK